MSPVTKKIAPEMQQEGEGGWGSFSAQASSTDLEVCPSSPKISISSQTCPKNHLSTKFFVDTYEALRIRSFHYDDVVQFDTAPDRSRARASPCSVGQGTGHGARNLR